MNEVIKIAEPQKWITFAAITRCDVEASRRASLVEG